MSPRRQAAKALKDLKYTGAPQRRPEANQGYAHVAPNPFWIDLAGAVRRFLGPDVPHVIRHELGQRSLPPLPRGSSGTCACDYGVGGGRRRGDGDSATGTMGFSWSTPGYRLMAASGYVPSCRPHPALAAKRASPKGARSAGRWPVSANRARRCPMSGPNLKPCPLKPHATISRAFSSHWSRMKLP